MMRSRPHLCFVDLGAILSSHLRSSAPCLALRTRRGVGQEMSCKEEGSGHETLAAAPPQPPIQPRQAAYPVNATCPSKRSQARGITVEGCCESRCEAKTAAAAAAPLVEKQDMSTARKRPLSSVAGRLAGKKAIVTGGGSGIGWRCIERNSRSVARCLLAP